MPDVYRLDPNKKIYNQQKISESWISEKDKKRIKEQEENKKIFDGHHYIEENGIWPHTMGIKALEQNIPYEQINILGNSSISFANIIAGEEINICCDNELLKEFLDKIEWQEKIWDSLVQASYYGFVGLQPIIKEKENIQYWDFDIVSPTKLFFHKDKTTNEIICIQKKILFEDVKIGEHVKDFLYVESHYVGLVITQLYLIENQKILQELDLEYFKYIDKEKNIVKERYTGLNDFEIIILINYKIESEIKSDYTVTAKKNQRSLNDCETRIQWILTVNSNPKLIAPLSAVNRNTDTGQWEWDNKNLDVLFYNDQINPNPSTIYTYLTWNGQLTEQRESKKNTIFALLSEIQLSPQFLSNTDLIGGTTADTDSKLKTLAKSTIKKSQRKTNYATKAYNRLLSVLSRLYGFDECKPKIIFENPFPESNIEKIQEISMRIANGTISKKKAIMEIDKTTDKEAEKIIEEIHNENSNMPTDFRDLF